MWNTHVTTIGLAMRSPLLPTEDAASPDDCGGDISDMLWSIKSTKDVIMLLGLQPTPRVG